MRRMGILLVSLFIATFGLTATSSQAVPPVGLHGTLVPLSAQSPNDQKLGGWEYRYTGSNAMARSYQDCSSFPGYLCVWDGAFATGRMRVFNNTSIGTGLSFFGTTWNNVITNAWNTAHSTTYRFWTANYCNQQPGTSGTYSPGAMGGWDSSSVFYHNISGLTVDGDNTCT